MPNSLTLDPKDWKKAQCYPNHDIPTAPGTTGVLDPGRSDPAALQRILQSNCRIQSQERSKKEKKYGRSRENDTFGARVIEASQKPVSSCVTEISRIWGPRGKGNSTWVACLIVVAFVAGHAM